MTGNDNLAKKIELNLQNNKVERNISIQKQKL